MQAQIPPQPVAPTLPEPGVPVIDGINWLGMQTLYVKEVRRFFKVQMQTIWAPAITTLMFLAIFTLALGNAKGEVLGFPYSTFLAPGLIIMGMTQNAFQNSMSSIIIGKVQGTIVDVLMPPLSHGELLACYVAGAVTRAWAVGLADGTRLLGATPGGANQMPWNAQTLARIAAGESDPGRLIAAPRWEWRPADDGVIVEDGFGPEAMGGFALAPSLHTVPRWAMRSAMQIVRVGADGAGSIAADPRTVGAALAL